MSNEELYHYGIKGMKWGIRRTPEQLGHRSSPKHRDAVKRRQYTNARVERSSSRLSSKYKKRFDKETDRYNKSKKDSAAKDRYKTAKDIYKQNMRDLGRNAKVNAGARDIGSWAVKSIAKNAIIPTAAFTGTVLALGATTPITSLPVVVAAANGASWLSGIGVNVSNVYRGYQTARNVVDIASTNTTKKKR